MRLSESDLEEGLGARRWRTEDVGPELREACERGLERTRERLLAHGDYPRFSDTIRRLGGFEGRTTRFNADAPRIDLSDEEADSAESALSALAPWRKGPFQLGSRLLDAEWRSDLKWSRVSDRMTPLSGRRVLDVGAGNGYYLLRMLGEGAAFVLGIEPSVLYLCQYLALARLFRPGGAAMLGVTLEEFAGSRTTFDSVFSMGVLYHRRDPIAHLRELRSTLGDGGELVLETLVVDGPDGYVLIPGDRYAMMRNVWTLPSVLTLEGWLREAGFSRIDVGPVCPTTSEEQRTTKWMPHPSLADFLDPRDGTKTVEGYPAPTRVVIVAQR